MNHTKSKSLITLVITLLLLFCMSISFAADSITHEVLKDFTLEVKLDGSTVTNGATLEGNYVGKTISITVNPNKMDSSLKIYVKWGEQNAKVIKEGSKTASYTIPNMAEGETVPVQIQATIDNDEENYVGRTDNFMFYLTRPVTVVETSVDVDVYNGTTKLSNGSTTTKEVGSKLKIKATVTNGTFQSIKYQWDLTGSSTTSTTNNIEISVPNFEAGSSHTLYVQASSTDGKKSSTKSYIIKIPDAVPETVVDVDVYNGTTKLSNGSTTTKEVGSKLKIKATVTNGTFQSIKYQWELTGSSTTSTTNNIEISVPNFEPGSSHTLYVQASSTDGKKSDTKSYIIKIPSISYSGTVSASSPNGPLSENNLKPSQVGAGDTITAKFEPEDNFSKFEYKWDDEAFKDLPPNKKISVPNFEPGTTHKLTIRGTLKDGNIVEKVYYITIPKVDDHNPDPGGELIIDPWMRKNEDAEGLLVALRNGSDQSKANKNFYMINEEVIYYVDYLNAGKEITDEVKLVLNLPLSFDVVESDGGVVDKDKKTITWTYPYGLVEGAEDTKVVKIKYTSLSKKSLNSEMIYPQAVIYQKSKAKDYSAVINCIYLDEDTKFDDIHDPYMYGDLEAPTFRPDDGIKRVEGAMVLLRIFGEDYLSVKNITTKYSDIEDTYKMGQQAITKATQLGIMSGYPDGSFKPNDKMTRAEFMRVIASYVAESADVKGLELKDNSAITIYNNKNNKSHWSNPYVTLLARLNMTSASEKEKDLKVDNTITRAEVAQLCNFYLFRAPAKVTSSTRIDFTDVNRSHKLISDIVEATRESHDYTVTEDGKEKIK